MIRRLVGNPLTLIALALAATALLYFYLEILKQFAAPRPLLPDVLRGATAGRRSPISCETIEGTEAAHSSEIVSRLKRRFPIGSAVLDLSDYLLAEGFQITTPCAQDRLIQMATFTQTRGGGLSYPAHAEIWWKVEGVSLACITASIQYTGL